MKIRIGFVSNSSSSSFVVRRMEAGVSDQKLTAKQTKALEKFGFRKTFAHRPDNVPAFHDKEEWAKERKFLKDKQFKNRYNYGYEIVCNQDDVMAFLVKNHISFVASCHYGHESIVYDSKTDTLYTGINYGVIIETYTVTELDNMLDRKNPVSKISGVEWLKNNRY